MKKKVFAATLAAVALSVGVLSGCTQVVGIKSIEKTATEGLVDTYTITYTDGSTTTFEVKNGADGVDSGVSIKSFTKTGSSGLTDYYTVTFTDGRTEVVPITNGKDAEDITINDVYEEYKNRYGEDMTFAEFCEKYLSLENPGTDDAVNSCLLSSMKIFSAFTTTKNYYDRWGNIINTSKSCAGSVGSGVIYKMEEDYTYILTNYHVVFNSKADITISDEIHAYMYGSVSNPVKADDRYTYDEYAIECEYVGGAIDFDVAVIKAKTGDVRAINPQAQPVKVANDYGVGETVYAIGNTSNEGISVTNGIVSVDREALQLDIDGTKRVYRSLRTDAMIYEGNSGGGLFNGKGELIGINHAGDSSLSFINYAIPVNVFVPVADGIIHYANTDSTLKGTKKLVLGITTVSENSRFVCDDLTGKGSIVEDVTVSTVEPSSHAEALGIKVGDVIKAVELNGVTCEITRYFDISDLLLRVRAGDSLRISYERGGAKAQTEALEVTAQKLTSCT